MSLPVDLDQFLVVNNIGYYYYGFNVILLGSIYPDGITYLPKEFFNMTQLISIYANTINIRGARSYYASKTKVNNHNKCRWTNLVNLFRVRNLNRYSETTGNKDILKELMSM